MVLKESLVLMVVTGVLVGQPVEILYLTRILALELLDKVMLVVRQVQIHVLVVAVVAVLVVLVIKVMRMTVTVLKVPLLRHRAVWVELVI